MSIGDQRLYGDVLMTKTGRKPPVFSVEQADEQGQIVKGNIVKCPRGQRGWILHLGKDKVKYFKTRRKAAEFFSRLQIVTHTETSNENTETPK